jgi:hypothetical protein
MGADYAEATDGDGEADIIIGPIGGGLGIATQADVDRDVFPLGKQLYESGANDICLVISHLPAYAKIDDYKPCNNTCKYI